MTRCFWKHTASELGQEGSVLVAVMAIMAALIIIFLASLTIAVVGYSRHVKANNRLTAQYLAESGIQRSLLIPNQSLNTDSIQSAPAPNGGSFSTYMVPWGPFRLAFSEGRFANQVVHTTALLGAPLPTPLRAAVTVSNSDYPLIVSGTTTITGDVFAGPLGITTGRFQGEDVVNEHYLTGGTLAIAHPPVFRIDSSILNQYLRDRDNRRSTCGSQLSASVSFGKDDFRYWKDATSITVENNAFIDGLRFNSRDCVYSLFADGRIEIKGHSQIHGTLEIVSNTYILLGDSADIDEALLYATDSIVICGTARFSGIAFCSGRITVRDRAVLWYPATLLIKSSESSKKDSTGVELTGHASGEATLIALSTSDGQKDRKPEVLLDSAVTLTGAILSQGVVDLRGKLFGAVWTPVFSFYSAPTTYVNWLRNCQIDRSKLGFTPAIPLLPPDSMTRTNRIVWQEEES